MPQVIDKRTKRRAEQARKKVGNMIIEMKNWKGTRPAIVRVNHGDYLALTECNLLNEWPGVEVKPG